MSLDDPTATTSMAPLFPEPTVETPSLFPEGGTTQMSPLRSPEQTNLLANLSAMATKMNTGTDETLSSIADRHRELIDSGKEDVVRQTVDTDAKTQHIQALQQAQIDAIQSSDSLGVQKVRSLMEKEQAVASNVSDPNALEKEGVAAVQAQGMQDPKQADAMRQSKQGVLEYMQDNMTKAALMNSAIDKIEGEIKQEGWGNAILDQMSLPFQTYYAQRSAMPGSGGLLPGTNLAQTAQRLFALPLDQFEKELPTFVDNVKHNSGVLWPNLHIAVSVLDSMRSGRGSVYSANLWGAVDLAGVLPTGTILKAVRRPAGLMLGVMNRAVARDTAAADILKDKMGAAANAGGVSPIHTPSDAVQLSLPSIVKTSSLTDGSVGVAGDIVQKISSLEKATAERQAGLNMTTRRMSPQQEALAIQARAKQFENELKNENVVDINNVSNPFKGYRTKIDVGGLDPQAQQELFDQHTANLDAFQQKLLNLKPEDLPKTITAEDAAKAQKQLDSITEDDGLIQELEHAQADRLAQERQELQMKQMMHADSTPDEAVAIKQSLADERTRLAQQPALHKSELFEYNKDAETGLNTITAWVGDRQGYGGFLEPDHALDAAEIKGWDPASVQLREEAGQWFLGLTTHVPEVGIMVPELAVKDLPVSGRIAEFFKNAHSMLHEYFAGPLIKQTHVKAGYKEQVVKPLVKAMQNTDKRGIKAVKAIIDMGQREENPASYNGLGKWYNLNEFASHFERIAGRAANEKDALSYYAYKELNDADWHIRNDTVFVDKARRGVKTVSITNPDIGLNIPRTNGWEVTSPDWKENIYDVEGGKWGKTADMQAKMQTGNYRVIELEAPFTGSDKEAKKFFLVNKQSSTVGPLARQQLAYVSGGHRFYENKWFVKQGVKTPVNGKDTWLSPLTHSNHKTYARAAKFAEKQEAARQVYQRTALDKSYALTPEDHAIFNRSAAGSYDKFDQLVHQGMIQPDQPFEALYDRGLPTAMNTVDPNIAKWFSEDVPSYEQELVSRGRMFYSPKGEHLTDEEGMLAPVLDPFKTIDRALGNAIQTKAFSSYNTKVTEEWARLARPFLLKNNMSDYEAFMHGELRETMKGTPEGLASYQALTRMRNIHKRLLGYKTGSQVSLDIAARRFAGYIETKGQLGDWVAGKTFNMLDASPLTAFRGFVFDATLGMFDPGRLLLHTQTALAAQTVHPVHGFQAGMMSPVIKFLTMNRNESVLEHVASWGKAITGFEKDDFKVMMRSLNESGVMNVSGDFGMNDSYALIQKANQLRDAGRSVFNWAEQYNRSVGWQIAWKVIREEHPELEVGGEDFLNKVHIKADDLTLNQTTASRAGWQQGILGLPTQFMQYQARMLERMLPKTFGGSAYLSTRQRARLIFGQAAMYGAAGVPGVGFVMNYANDQYQKATGKPLDDEVWRGLTKGFWDSLIFETTGTDTAWAQRAGIGDSWANYWSDMAGGHQTSVLSAFGGPTLEMADTMWDNAVKLTRYFQAEQIDQLSPEEWGLVASDMVTPLLSLNRAQKAYWIMKTGFLMDPKTGERIAPADSLDAVAAALGIPLEVEKFRGEFAQTEQERADLVRVMSKQVAVFRSKAIQAIDEGDTEGQDHWNRMATGWLQIFRDNPQLQQDIFKESTKINSNIGTELEQMIRRSRQQTGQAPVGENH